MRIVKTLGVVCVALLLIAGGVVFYVSTLDEDDLTEGTLRVVLDRRNREAVVSVDGREVTHADNFEPFFVPLGHPDHHVLQQGAGHTMVRP